MSDLHQTDSSCWVNSNRLAMTIDGRAVFAVKRDIAGTLGEDAC